MMSQPTRFRIGLAASGGPGGELDGQLFRFISDLRPFFADVLGAELHILGSTYDCLAQADLLGGLSAVRLPAAHEGGLITLTAELVGLDATETGLDWIIFFQDPRDPISLYPETQALKRQCVVHGKVFLSTVGGASEWCLLEWLRRCGPGAAPAGLVERWVRPLAVGEETIALIAHDTMKQALVEFTGQRRALLSRFGRRLATGTTGALLNGQTPARLAPGSVAPLAGVSPGWVHGLLSGPQGGDAQIAQQVVAGRCRRAVFFEDPHVAREHEADIQLLERATRFSALGCLCMLNPAMANRWADNMTGLLGAGGAGLEAITEL